MSVEILQLTDLHLLSDPDATLKGVSTHKSLVDVLDFIDAGLNAGRWNIDVAVITGDMAHDEQLATYETLKELFVDRFPRLCLIPGNHDDRNFIRRVFPEAGRASDEYITFSEELAGWRLLGVDSHVRGEVPGRVDEQHLEWLKGELTQHADQPTVLFTHHPPFKVQSEWLDKIGLREPDALNDLIGAFSQIRVVSAGHVHQHFEGRLGDVNLLTTPSTAVQFKPHAVTLVCDPIAPGFRVFKLDGDAIQTEVVRLAELEKPI